MNNKYRVRAPGPTPLPEETRQAMARRPGYHRTKQFSDVIERVVDDLRQLLNVDWPVLPLASSGTGGMEMAMQNTVSEGDKALVIGGGKFGERWKRMVEAVGATVVDVDVDWGEAVSPTDVIDELERQDDITAVFGTMVETSTLVRHPVEEIGHYLADRDELFVVDAITAAGAEPLHPSEWGMDLVVLGAQKGLMGPPGLAFVVSSPDAVQRARDVASPTTYFDLPKAVDRLREDSQTPWTPPMQLLRAQQVSLAHIFEEGLENVYNRHESLAERCRRSVRAMGLSVFADRPAVAGTAVELPDGVDGDQLQRHIHDTYRCYIPGGQKQWTGRLIRIGHLGYVDELDLQQALTVLDRGLSDVGWTEHSSDWLDAFRGSDT